MKRNKVFVHLGNVGYNENGSITKKTVKLANKAYTCYSLRY